MSIEEALRTLGKEEAFRATVYAMNTLLIQKGVYSAEEFERLFCEHAINFKSSFQPRSKRVAGSSREAVVAIP